MYQTEEFINSRDLETYSKLDEYMYDDNCKNYFIRETKKAPWETIIHKKLEIVSKNETNLIARITRAGDLLLDIWVRITIPEIKLTNNGKIRWVKNLAHSLIKRCAIVVNDVELVALDSHFIDFYDAFLAPDKLGYKKMINVNSDDPQFLPETILVLPLPFWFSKHDDQMNCLPVARLPYVDKKLEVNFHKLSELLVYEGNELPFVPQISNIEVWAHYSMANSQSRKDLVERGIVKHFIQTPLFIGEEFIVNSLNSKLTLDCFEKSRALFIKDEEKNITELTFSCKPIHENELFSDTIMYNYPVDISRFVIPFYSAEKIPDSEMYLISFDPNLKNSFPNSLVDLRNSTLEIKCKSESQKLIIRGIGYKMIEYSGGMCRIIN